MTSTAANRPGDSGPARALAGTSSRAPAGMSSRTRARSLNQRRAAVLLHFLGSMTLAIHLLVAVALASVIGTVLQQNQPYADYQVKFGSFWFPVFETLGLYDVYAAGWFVGILAFLIMATCTCLVRHTPVVLGQMGQYRAGRQAATLRGLGHHREWQSRLAMDALADRLEAPLRRQGYRIRRKQQGHGLMLAGLAGRSNRLGYIFTHLAVVLIFIGGLLDSNLGMKLRAWSGQLQPETRPMAVADMPAHSRLAAGWGAFRGSVTIPEGDRASAVFLPLKDGYVARDLPFQIRLQAFRVEHYASGQPRSYASDVILSGPGMAEPLHRTIKVNQPLAHDGYHIYQQSFTDGGSGLSLRAWPLVGEQRAGKALQGRVMGRQSLGLNGEDYRLEFTGFDLYNIGPAAVEGGATDTGPSFRYLLRKPDGQALEFENSMLPMDLEGGRYFISGVRGSVAEPFRYLHIPADQQDSPRLFLAFAAILTGSAVEVAAGQAVRGVLQEAGMAASPMFAGQLQAAVLEQVERYLAAGYVAAVAPTRTAPLDGAGTVAAATSPQGGLPAATVLALNRQLLDDTLLEAYRLALGQTGDEAGRRLGANDIDFLEHAIATVPALQRYGAPVFLQLEGFQHRQASGLEITRSPGKPVVYAGFIMLLLGIVLMFYVRYRRIWCWLEPAAGGTRILLAGASERDPLGFNAHFRDVQQTLAAVSDQPVQRS